MTVAPALQPAPNPGGPPPSRGRRILTLLPVVLAFAGGAAVAVLQLRTGILPGLDSGSYLSASRATASGHLFSTTLAPSFSNFTPADFLERGARLPFVDFPVGYPTIAGGLGAVTGVDAAMITLQVISAACVSALVVVGIAPRRDVVETVIRLTVGVLLPVIPIFRIVTRAALSEPLFCAVALGLVVALGRYRRGDVPWWPVVLLGASVGLFRFIGAPLVALAAGEHLRRNRKPLAALGWMVVMVAPAATNVVWAASVGGGHNVGWRGMSSLDLRLTVRSVGGWFDRSHGDFLLSYFGGSRISWWAVLVTVAVFALMLYALVATVADDLHTGRRLPRLPLEMQLPFAAAAIVTLGLILGILGFDALVVPDNRLMLPSGILILSGLTWALGSVAAQSRTLAVRVGALILVFGWGIVAAEPWTVTDFGNPLSGGSDAAVRVARSTGAAVILANEADSIYLGTAIPSAYLPQAVSPLSGKPVDLDAIYSELPCLMAKHNAVIIRSAGGLFVAAEGSTVSSLIESGRFVREVVDGVTVIRAGERACV